MNDLVARMMAVAAAAVAAAVLGVVAGPADAEQGDPKKGVDVKILDKWVGSYPIKALDKLPKDQQTTGVGFIGDAKTFEAVFSALEQPEKMKVPTVDFKENFVLFARNIRFVNTINIGKVLNKEGAITILAMETLTARPIEDHVKMCLVVVPRAGIKSIQNGKTTIPVEMGAGK